MTYKELLDSVSFDEIVPYIEKYLGGKGCLALYKIHYDMLCHLTPNPEDAYYKTATVSHGEQDEDWPEPHLTVHPIEGPKWEGALTMELIIEPDVTESLAEIAACCLWHTSFYGFTEEQVQKRVENLGYYDEDLTDRDIIRLRAKNVIRTIDEAGGNIPSEDELMKIPSFRVTAKNNTKRKQREYWDRIGMIGEFVARNLPSDTDVVNMTVEDLCKLFYSNHYIEYDYNSNSADESVRADYLKELITSYEAFAHGTLDNAVIVLSASKQYPLIMEETSLATYIAEMCTGESHFIYKVDETLGRELRLNVAFYSL